MSSLDFIQPNVPHDHAEPKCSSKTSRNIQAVLVFPSVPVIPIHGTCADSVANQRRNIFPAAVMSGKQAQATGSNCFCFPITITMLAPCAKA